MKKTIFYPAVTVLVLCSLLFFSCERTAVIKLPEHRPALVVHGYVATGDTFRVALGRTQRADVPVVDSNMLVKNGWVLLYENGVFLDSLEYRPMERLYVSSAVTAVSGRTYKIVAGAPGFTTVEAVTTAPLPVTPISLWHVKNARTNSEGSLLDDLRIRFTDPAGEKNYYLLHVRSAHGPVCIYTDDPVVERVSENVMPVDGSLCLGRGVLFTDQSFNGQQKEMILSGLAHSFDPYTGPWGDMEKAYIQRYNVTEAYYKYYKLTGYYNPDALTLSNPVVVRGNVKNGYGLFTVFSAAVDSIP